MGLVTGDPQGTQQRAMAAGSQHEPEPQGAPASFRRKQLLVLAVMIALPILAYLLSRWL